MKTSCVKIVLVFGIIALFICTGITPSIAVDNIEQCSMPISNGKTLYVGGSGEGNYTTIKSAVNDATDGDTVFVYDDSSPYCEHVYVGKSINLIGENRDTTVIDGGGIGTVVLISADRVTISGFTIQGCGSYYYMDDAGIRLDESDNNTITDNIITINTEDGIYLYYSSGNIIASNTFSNNDYALYLANSISNTIADNNFSKNADSIYLSHSSSNTITGNNIISNRRHGSINILSGSNNNIITGNTISNTYYHGILFMDSNNNIVTGNTISNNRNGIKLYDSNSNTFIGNTISHNIRGISPDDSNSNTIMCNNIMKNMFGIAIWFCNKITITNNNIQKNIIGCWLFQSSNVIEKNNFIGNIKQATHISSLNTTWNSNYWDNWMGLKIGLELFQRFPKIIFGRWLGSGFIPWILFDWHPAKKPYDIGV